MHLSRKELESLLVNPRISPGGNDLYAECPFCGHDEFGISLNGKHPFNCFRKKDCGEPGSIKKLLKHLGKEDFFENRVSIDISKPLEFSLEPESEVSKGLYQINIPPLYRRLKCDKYLESRGLTKSDFEKYNIGYEINKSGFVIFVVYHNNQPVGWVKRCKRKKIYLNLGNLSSTFFGVDDVVDGVDTVILVEGIFDKLSIDKKLGLNNSKNIKCLATFGAKISDEQVKILKEKRIKNIYMMFEADVLKTVKKTSMRIENIFNSVKVAYLPDEDPDEMNSYKLLNKLKTSIKPFEFYYKYL